MILYIKQTYTYIHIFNYYLSTSFIEVVELLHEKEPIRHKAKQIIKSHVTDI